MRKKLLLKLISKNSYKKEDAAKKDLDNKKAKIALKNAQNKLMKTEKLFKEAEIFALEPLHLSNQR